MSAGLCFLEKPHKVHAAGSDSGAPQPCSQPLPSLLTFSPGPLVVLLSERLCSLAAWTLKTTIFFFALKCKLNLPL